MIFVNFARSRFLYKKRKIKEKEKDLHELGLAHNEVGPIARM
jgi:hypothetical protein